MYRKYCKACGEYSYSASRSGPWFCSSCGQDITDAKTMLPEQNNQNSKKKEKETREGMVSRHFKNWKTSYSQAMEHSNVSQ